MGKDDPMNACGVVVIIARSGPAFATLVSWFTVFLTFVEAAYSPTSGSYLSPKSHQSRADCAAGGIFASLRVVGVHTKLCGG